MGIAVDGRGRTENELINAKFLHELADDERGIDVVAVVLNRERFGFSDRFIAGKMHNRVETVLFENTPHGRFVAHIDGIFYDLLARELLQTFDRLGRAVAVVVGYDDVDAGVEEFNRRVRADIACAACEKNRFQFRHIP